MCMIQVVSNTMALAMDEPLHGLDLFSAGYTPEEHHHHHHHEPHRFMNWNLWSPPVDWDAFHGCHDDFNDLIKELMVETVEGAPQYPPTSAVEEDSSNNNDHDSNSGGSSTDANMIVYDDDKKGEDIKGLRLVHLLMAAAEALTGVNKSRDLARVILVRLKELVSPSGGTNMERLAAYFTEALHNLVECEPASGLHSSKSHLVTSGLHHRDDHNPTDVIAAFQLLLDTSPYVKFGHFTANQAILEAVANDRRVHIVDYDIMEGIQWASLMQALVTKKDSPPPPHLRITAISRGGSRRRFIGTVQETGRRLMAFAAAVGIPFSFHQCRLDSDESFKPSNLKLVRGEALVINCMLHLPHFNYRSPDSIASFLSGSKSLNPRIITLLEEEVGPTEDGSFIARFMDTLHHYSAIYDSLEAGFPMQNKARTLMELVFLGPRISASMARIYRTRKEEEIGSWGDWLGAGGLREVNLSFANHCQARLLLRLFNDGYRVENVANNKIVLGWKNRSLLSASVWSSSSSSSSSSESES